MMYEDITPSALDEARSLIKGLHGDDWEVDASHGGTRQVGNWTSVSTNADVATGYHSYYRTKRVGVARRVQESSSLSRHIDGSLLEGMEFQLTAVDAGEYFKRDTVAKAAAKDLLGGIKAAVKDGAVSLEDLALAQAIGENTDKFWDRAQRIVYRDGQQYVHQDRKDEARQYVSNTLAPLIRAAMDRTSVGHYSTLIRDAAAISKDVAAQTWLAQEPPSSPPPLGGSPGDGDSSGDSGDSSNGQNSNQQNDQQDDQQQSAEQLLDSLADSLSQDLADNIEATSEQVQEEQEELDNAKTTKLGWLGGVGSLREVNHPLERLDSRFNFKTSGVLAQMNSKRHSKLKDEGLISAPDAWELLYGQTEVWEAPRKKSGRLLVLADMSGSTHCVCGKGRAATKRVTGAVIMGIAHAIAAPFPKSEVWAYSRGRQLIPQGMRPLCQCEVRSGRRGTVFGHGTPDLEALKWAVEKEKHMDGVSIVIVCDGNPDDIQRTREFATELVKGGVRFGVVLVQPVVDTYYQRSRERLLRELEDAKRKGEWERERQVRQFVLQGGSAYPASASVVINAAPWAGNNSGKETELRKLKDIFSLLNRRH